MLEHLIMAGVAAVTPACPAAVPFGHGLQVIDVVRVVTGANGESEFVDAKLTAKSRAYFKPGELFSAIDIGAAKRVQLISGPPNSKLPMHASLGYEMFLTIQGGSTVTLPNGQRRVLKPGSLVIMEDMGSKTGHAGETGPCGYVSVQVVPSAPLKFP